MTELIAGENLVVYTGKVQTAFDAFASIEPYLLIAYRWNYGLFRYDQVVGTNIMFEYGVYSVKVTQDCSWTYGIDAAAPLSVNLLASNARGASPVAYCGPQQTVEKALTSIRDYFIVGYYYDNVQKDWFILYSGYMMVPNTPYAIGVSQDCNWSFVAEPIPGFSYFEINFSKTVKV